MLAAAGSSWAKRIYSGQRGSLFLHRITLEFTTPSRFYRRTKCIMSYARLQTMKMEYVLQPPIRRRVRHSRMLLAGIQAKFGLDPD
jgi:hypothetical protein